jgi:hypothetical protein
MVDPAERFIGTWHMLSWIIRDGAGRVSQPLGPDAKGLLTYTADGYMFAALATPDRQRHAVDDPMGGTPEEARASMASYHSYCGRYRFEGEGVIVHTVEMSAFPNMVGTEQRRFYRFEGNRLHLTTPPLTRKGSTGVGELVWERVSQ